MSLITDAWRGWIGQPARRGRCLLAVSWRDRWLRALFAVLLLVDLAWILWFIYAKYLLEAGITEDLYDLKHLRITAEGGWPEQYNYAKTLVLIGLLGWLAVSTRRVVYAVLTLLFMVVLADDSFAIHETVGRSFRREYDIEPMFGLRAQDVGELMTWGLIGVVLGPILLAAMFFARGVHRLNGRAMLLVFAALVFCAMFVDQLYNAYHELFFGAGILLDVVEDGGEMMVITVACVLAAVLVKHGPAAGLPEEAPTPGAPR